MAAAISISPIVEALLLKLPKASIPLTAFSFFIQVITSSAIVMAYGKSKRCGLSLSFLRDVLTSAGISPDFANLKAVFGPIPGTGNNSNILGGRPFIRALKCLDLPVLKISSKWLARLSPIPGISSNLPSSHTSLTSDDRCSTASAAR